MNKVLGFTLIAALLSSGCVQSQDAQASEPVVPSDHRQERRNNTNTVDSRSPSAPPKTDNASRENAPRKTLVATYVGKMKGGPSRGVQQSLQNETNITHALQSARVKLKSAEDKLKAAEFRGGSYGSGINRAALRAEIDRCRMERMEAQTEVLRLESELANAVSQTRGAESASPRDESTRRLQIYDDGTYRFTVDGGFSTGRYTIEGTRLVMGVSEQYSEDRKAQIEADLTWYIVENGTALQIITGRTLEMLYMQG